MTKMNALIDPATILAQAAPAGPGGNGTIMVVAYGLLFVAMYFFMIAPQRKKQKEHQKLLESIDSGDQVLTAGGIYGEVTNKKEDRFIIRIAEGVKIEVLKSAVTTLVKKSGS